VGEPKQKPLIDWVLARFPDTPKRRAKEWIVGGRVTVGGHAATKPHQLMDDPADSLQLVTLRKRGEAMSEPLRIHPRVTLLYLDASLAVLDKGAGILAVPSEQKALSALSVLADFLAGRLRPMKRATPTQHAALMAFRRLTPLPVHRLDQFTSGVFCVAMNPQARANLIEQFRAHTVTRQYVGFAEGRLKLKHGEWRHWLWGREGELRQHVLTEQELKLGRVKAVEAVTRFELLREFCIAENQVVTKLRFMLDTGRTHQIRAQAAAEGVPLVGDRLYNPVHRPSPKSSTGQTKQRAGTIEFERQALHAERLALNHPESGERMEWRAPLPDDLRKLEVRLRDANKTRGSDFPSRQKAGGSR
jgi:23S rRNA pseudouridine1911/1915/1917 synthase